ncbi:MAG: SIS domain-containing protein, partial [Acidobacteria bacterium]|nr:SIS domain-containing protein [Acidobacteriota bacterium]
ESEVTQLAERYRFMTRAVVLGRGLNYGTAFEFSLKLMETCYVMAERFSAADFLHGPIAMVDPGVPVFIFCPAGPTWPAMQQMLSKVRDARAEAVIISDAGNPEALAASERVIRLRRKLDERVTPIPYIIPAQIFAASLAIHKGVNPDRPRTLSKVTKTM